MGSHDWLLFATATLALNLTPGPDMLYVSARSMSQGRSAGVLSALGVSSGCLVHTLLVAFGLAGLLARVPLAYDLVRYAGAAYLIHLGLRTLITPAAQSMVTSAAPAARQLFLQGLLTNVLNPKVALFFLAFLPQFADPSRGALWWQLLMLGLLFNLSGTVVNLGVALIGSATRRLTGDRYSSGHWWRRLAAVVFIGLGARLALAGER